MLKCCLLAKQGETWIAPLLSLYTTTVLYVKLRFHLVSRYGRALPMNACELEHNSPKLWGVVLGVLEDQIDQPRADAIGVGRPQITEHNHRHALIGIAGYGGRETVDSAWMANPQPVA